MGTYTLVEALPCSPEHGRRPTVTAQVANFGVSAPRRAEYVASNPELVLGRFLFGFADVPSRGGLPWTTYDPDQVLDIRRDILGAIAAAAAVGPSDEYANWWGSQLRAADRVLAHAARHREWVVAVFEGHVACFERGGIPDPRPGDFVFSPHCTVAPESRVVPLGVAGVLAVGLAIAGWRHRRFVGRVGRR